MAAHAPKPAAGDGRLRGACSADGRNGSPNVAAAAILANETGNAPARHAVARHMQRQGSPMITTCETCRELFTLRRRSARFCSDRCRVAAYRARAAVTGATPRRATNDAVKASPRSLVPAVMLRVPPGVVPDAVYRGMFRIRLPGGGLSAMVNLTRARDALRTLRESRVCVSYSASAATGDADRRLPIVRGCVAP